MNYPEAPPSHQASPYRCPLSELGAEDVAAIW
jgi:hypothetical protein